MSKPNLSTKDLEILLLPTFSMTVANKVKSRHGH